MFLSILSNSCSFLEMSKKIAIFFVFSDISHIMNYGKDLLEYTKFSCNSVAMPLLIQISLCLISCTLSGYAASIIVLRFTLLNNELITTSFTLIFLVRNNEISLTVNHISLS